MAGLQFPTDVLGGLSWNRLIRETYVAQPVPNPLSAKREVLIPPVAIPGKGFIYLVGCDSESASPNWRLGCSVRLSSDGSPDSGGLFTDPNGLPIRIDDRQTCTLGSYTLLTWPNMNIERPWLVIEFPFWLDDVELEIFWYDGDVSHDFSKSIRESVVELYLDPVFLDEINGSVKEWLSEQIVKHKEEDDPHTQYLSKSQAQSTYTTHGDIHRAIVSHLISQNHHNTT